MNSLPWSMRHMPFCMWGFPNRQQTTFSILLTRTVTASSPIVSILSQLTLLCAATKLWNWLIATIYRRSARKLRAGFGFISGKTSELGTMHTSMETTSSQTTTNADPSLRQASMTSMRTHWLVSLRSIIITTNQRSSKRLLLILSMVLQSTDLITLQIKDPFGKPAYKDTNSSSCWRKPLGS